MYVEFPTKEFKSFHDCDEHNKFEGGVFCLKGRRSPAVSGHAGPLRQKNYRLQFKYRPFNFPYSTDFWSSLDKYRKTLKSQFCNSTRFSPPSQHNGVVFPHIFCVNILCKLWRLFGPLWLAWLENVLQFSKWLKRTKKQNKFRFCKALFI